MLIVLPEASHLPLYQQIVDAVKEQLFAGALKPGDEMPPVRVLAESLGINLHTVRHAYQILEAEGLITMGLGRRTRIRSRPVSPVNEETENLLFRRWKELERDAWLRGLDREQFARFVQTMLHAAAATKG